MTLLAAGLGATTPGLADTVLPEQLLPGLDAILKKAVVQSPRMLNRNLDLELAENDRIQAKAAVLPSVNAYYNFYKSRDDRADQSGVLDVDKVAYNLSISQPLFHWGERRNTARIGEIRAAISQGQYREGYRLLVQTIRGDYMRLVVQKTVLTRARYYRDYTDRVLKQQEERLAKKVISESEMFSVRLSAEQAQIGLDRAEMDYANAKASFARLAGIGSISDEAIPDSLPVLTYTAPSYQAVLAGFLSQKELVNTESENLRRQLEIENLNYLNAKTRLRPKFNFVIGASQDEQSYTVNVAQKYRVNSYYAGLAANWTIFDGFASGAATRNTLARRRQLENDVRELNDRLAQDAQTQTKLLEFAARGMSISDRFLTSGEGNLRAKQADFARGACSEAEVSLAQISLYDAQVNAYTGRLDFLLRVGELLGLVMKDPALANLPSAK